VIDFQNRARKKPSQRFLSICFYIKRISKIGLGTEKNFKSKQNDHFFSFFAPQKSFQGLNFFL